MFLFPQCNKNQEERKPTAFESFSTPPKATTASAPSTHALSSPTADQQQVQWNPIQGTLDLAGSIVGGTWGFLFGGDDKNDANTDKQLKGCLKNDGKYAASSFKATTTTASSPSHRRPLQNKENSMTSTTTKFALPKTPANEKKSKMKRACTPYHKKRNANMQNYQLRNINKTPASKKSRRTQKVGTPELRKALGAL